jgi:hypothetical protein
MEKRSEGKEVFKMLLSIKRLSSFKISAIDGDIGGAYCFLFDDRNWIVRYMVIDTGSWLPGKKVLIAPAASIEKPQGEMKHIPVRLTKDQIEASPDIDTDMPVSRKQEIELHRHYNWIPYWGGAYGLVGCPIIPYRTSPTAAQKESERSDETESEENADPHLRSTKEVIDYRINALDGEMGHLADFILDVEDWIIRYIVVDTKNWWPGKTVLISPDWIHEIRWKDSTVSVSMSKADIKDSPEYDPALPINMEYEARLYDYYGRSKYWA